MLTVAVLLLRFGSGVAEVALATLPITHWLPIARTLPTSRIVIAFAGPTLSDGIVQVVVPKVLYGGVAQETPAGAVTLSKLRERRRDRGGFGICSEQVRRPVVRVLPVDRAVSGPSSQP
jgi:hypothetical protein